MFKKNPRNLKRNIISLSLGENSKDRKNSEKYRMLFMLKKMRAKPEVVDVTGCMVTLPHSAPGGPCKCKYMPKQTLLK